VNIRLTSAALALLLFAGPAASAGAATLVLMPLDNVSGEQSAQEILPPLLAKAVAAKGWNVATGNDIESLLEQRRIRYFDFLGDDVRQSVLTSAGASAILTITVYTYAQTRNASIGLTARLVDAAGSTQWSNIAGLTSKDTERALGFGEKNSLAELAPQAVAMLLNGFPCGSCVEHRAQAIPRESFRRRALSYSDPDLDHTRPICILPFDNESSVPEAVRLVADVLALRLEAAGFTVINPTMVRDAALKARISFHKVGSQDLLTLAKAIGTPLFLRGTIYRFDDPVARNGTPTPALDLEVTLVDVRAGRILWAVQDDRKGTDYTGFLMLGAISNSVSLTDRVATEIIATARINHDKKNHSGAHAPSVSAVRDRGQQNTGKGER